MWLVAVVGRCVVGCEHYEGFCSTKSVVLLRTLVGMCTTVKSRGVLRQLELKTDWLALLHTRQDPCSNLTEFLVPPNECMDS